MGRWGLRQIATLSVLVWVMAACGSAIPAPPLEPPTTQEATLILRTAGVSPPLVTSTTSSVNRASDVATLPPASRQEVSDPAPPTPALPTAPLSETQPTILATHPPPATPYYYTVLVNDTLSGIARQFGLNLADLQAANGNLPPDMVYPGQVLLIPLEMSAFRPDVSGTDMSGSTFVFASLTGTAVRLLPTTTPLPLTLNAPVCHNTPADEVVCLGWIDNTLTQPVGHVAVRINLLDETGDSLAQRTTTLPQQIIAPGERAPYAVRLPAPPTYQRISVELLNASPYDSAGPVTTVPLTVIDPNWETGGVLVQVGGTLRHDGEQPAEEVLVVVTLLDEAEQITGLRIHRVTDMLQPGATLTIDLPVTPLQPGTSQVKIYAEASWAE